MLFGDMGGPAPQRDTTTAKSATPQSAEHSTAHNQPVRAPCKRRVETCFIWCAIALSPRRTGEGGEEKSIRDCNRHPLMTTHKAETGRHQLNQMVAECLSRE